MLYYVAKKDMENFDDKLPLKLLNNSLTQLSALHNGYLRGRREIFPALSSAEHKILNLQRSSVSEFRSALK